jgi:DNA-binding HxlR family transcriptional regulator
MQGPTDERRHGVGDPWTVERAIVLQLLREDHEQRWTRAELTREIPDFEPAMLDEALTRLDREGVLHWRESSVWASRAARRLDELELISV